MRLSLQEINSLVAQGFSAGKIAKIDGTVKRGTILTKLWREKNPGYAAQQRRDHLEKWRKERNQVKKRRQEESLLTAENAHQPWTSSELEYLERNGQRLTTKELAIYLRRTHNAVRSAANKYGISLYDRKKCLAGK